MKTQDAQTLWLGPIPDSLRPQARQAFAERDAVGFLCSVSNGWSISLVANNIGPLLKQEIYEEALLHAVTANRSNNRTVSLRALQRLFACAKRERLRAAGDPLCGSGPFTLYRGVAGVGRSRRVCGISWTGNFDTAVWFAKRYPLPDPAVFKAIVPEKYILARVHESFRDEDEFLTVLPAHIRPERVSLDSAPGDVALTEDEKEATSAS